jgi:hypothetical protein
MNISNPPTDGPSFSNPSYQNEYLPGFEKQIPGLVAISSEPLKNWR